MLRKFWFGLAVVMLSFLTVGVVQAAPIDAVLKASPESYTGGICPAVITFKGHIRVLDKTLFKNKDFIDVAYKFIRSDGAMSAINRLKFHRPEAQPVSTTWTLGGQSLTVLGGQSLTVYAGWEAIEIISPVMGIKSDKATFSIKCKLAPYQYQLPVHP